MDSIKSSKKISESTSILGAKQLIDLFPFHILLKRDLAISQTGYALQKILGDISNHLFFNHFHVDALEGELDFNNLSVQNNKLCYLENSKNDLVLKGAFYNTSDKDFLLFVGNVLPNYFNKLSSYNVTIKDIPVFDSFNDFLLSSRANIKTIQELTHLQNKTKEARDLNDRILHTSDHFFYIVTLDNENQFNSNFSYISNQIEKIHGSSIHEIKSNKKMWRDHIHPDDLNGIIKLNREMFKSGTPCLRTYRVKHYNSGKYIWLEDHIHPVKNDKGQVVELYGSGRDITNRKREEDIKDVIFGIESKLFNTQTLSEYCRYIHYQLSKVVNTENFYLSSYNAPQKEVSFIYMFDNNIELNSLPPSRVEGKGLTEIVIKRRKGLWLKGSEVRSFQEKEGLKIYGELAKSWVGVPLFSGNRVSGVLAMQSFSDVDAFTEDDMNLLEFVGNRIGAFIDRKMIEGKTEKLASVVSNSTDAIISCDIKGQIVSWNLASQKLFGYSEKEILNRDHMILVPENLSEEIKFLADKVLNNGESFAIETVRLHKNNTPIEVGISAFPLTDGESNITGISAIIRDLREIKNTEKKFKNIFNNSTDEIYIIDPKSMTFLEVNQKACETLGYNLDEMLGMHLSTITPSKSFFRKNIFKIANVFLGGTASVEVLHKKKDGTLYPIELNVKMIEYDGRKALLGLARNISERNKSKELIEQSEYRYKMLVDTVNEGVIQVDNNNVIKYVNDQFCQMTGYLAIDLLGKNALEFLIEDKDERKKMEERRLYGLQGKSDRFKIKFRTMEGREKWILISAAPILDLKGKVLGSILTIIDITDQILAEIGLKNELKNSIEYQSMLLSAQMNPHFIFNALSSIQYYILEEDTESSINFLSDFSKLMRMTLENSRFPSINVTSEVEYLNQYLKLEKFRHRNNFEYSIFVDANIEDEYTFIPPMFLQPFIENTIIHGLSNKEQAGKISISLYLVKGGKIKCIIEDNGVGRKKARELKYLKEQPSHESRSLGITEKRIELLEMIYEDDFKINIIDLYNESGNSSGTRVEVVIPAEFE